MKVSPHDSYKSDFLSRQIVDGYADFGCFGEHLLDKRIYPGENSVVPKVATNKTERATNKKTFFHITLFMTSTK